MLVKNTSRLTRRIILKGLGIGLKILCGLITIILATAILFFTAIAVFGLEPVLMAWIRYERNIWNGLIIYLLGVSVAEMIVHELGHYCLQRKFGVKILFFRIGVFTLLKNKMRSGTYFIIGIPFLAAESRALGEVFDKEQERDNPESFYYRGRHPKQRLAIAVAGPAAALIVCLGIAACYWFGYQAMAFPVPMEAIIILTLIACNQLANFFLPMNFFGFPNDALVAWRSLLEWFRWRNK